MFDVSPTAASSNCAVSAKSGSTSTAKSWTSWFTHLSSARLDYCNSILAGLFRRAYWAGFSLLVLGLQPRDHIKPALFELHWLPVHLRIDYKLCLVMHSATVQCCPRYISDIVHRPLLHHLADKDCAPLQIHFHIQFQWPTPSLENARFQWLVHRFGTLCQQTFSTLQTSLHSSVISRPTFLTSILILSPAFVFIRYSGFRLHIELCNTPVDSFCN